MSTTESVQLMERLHSEGRLRSWTLCCDDDGIYSVVLHWTHRRVPTVRSARVLGEAVAAAVEEEK